MLQRSMILCHCGNGGCQGAHICVLLSMGEYENEIYNMFGDIQISNEIPDEYQFEEDKSGDEDGVLAIMNSRMSPL